MTNGCIHVCLFQDKKSVESTCLCFARLVDNFQHEEVYFSISFQDITPFLLFPCLTFLYYLLHCPYNSPANVTVSVNRTCCRRLHHGTC